MVRISNYLPTPRIQLAMCTLVWVISGCASLTTDTNAVPSSELEKEVVTGVWVFEDDQIEIKHAKVENAELLPAPTNKNATRFTIYSTSNKLVKYKTEQFKVDENQINALQKTSLLNKSHLADVDKDFLRGDAILSSFRGSVVMHREVPVEFTLQNTDIDGNTPYVYSRVSMQVIAREFAGEQPLVTTIECVSFPKFSCVKLDSPQSARF